ncbi:hypothetical protein LSTR_LSTR005896 [Laodelphax striatellus]|uniref:Uncharacterized protein n=1 Tax=Laodelphax striatellus TaxID=195883 RepID=A0A482WSV9_LAOST|nr:hypothetical protein LSTR_LSTR005896 [Laodelphax striatellus]
MKVDDYELHKLKLRLAVAFLLSKAGTDGLTLSSETREWPEKNIFDQLESNFVSTNKPTRLRPLLLYALCRSPCERGLKDTHNLRIPRMTASSAASWDTLTQTTTKSIELAHVRRLSQEGAAPRNSTAGRRADQFPIVDDSLRRTKYQTPAGESWRTQLSDFSLEFGAWPRD